MDKNHQYLHILSNLVNNKGESIKDYRIGLKGKKLLSLTLKYGLKEANSKYMSLINLESLSEKDC